MALLAHILIFYKIHSGLSNFVIEDRLSVVFILGLNKTLPLAFQMKGWTAM
jgi:hypothetical protein